MDRGSARAWAAAGQLHPARPQRELRELTRYRASLIQERGPEVNRLQKTLEAPTSSWPAWPPTCWASRGAPCWRRSSRGRPTRRVGRVGAGRCGQAAAAGERAWRGRWAPTTRFLVARQLAHIDILDELLADLSAEIAERLRPFAAAAVRLDTIPASGRTAEVWWRNSGPTCGAFRPRRTWPRGQGCAPATTRAPASAGGWPDPQGAKWVAGAPR